MSPKSIFLKDKDLAKWWVSVAHDDRFEKVASFVLAEIALSAPNQPYLEGAKGVLDTMATISDNPVDLLDSVSPGMKHAVESMPERPKTE